jgi:hypothetical protein
MRTMTVDVTVDVDIDPWDVIAEVDEEELADYLRESGYSVSKESEELDMFDREDLNFLLNIVSDASLEGRRVYDKLKNLRFG